MATSPLQFGRYWPGTSPVHSIDPRTKLLLLIGLASSALIMDSPLSLTVLLILPLLGYKIAGLSLFEALIGMKKFLWLLTFTTFLQLFWTPGTVFLKVPVGEWKLDITLEGVRLAWLVSTRLTTVIIGANLLSATTSPCRLSSGLGHLLSPLRRMGLSVDEIVLAFSIGMQFLPIILDEAEEIKRAQVSRGIGHLHPNPLVRLYNMNAILVPLVARTIRRIDELSQAMIIRGYREGLRRSSLYPLGFGRQDLFFTLAALIGLALSLAAGYINIFNQKAW